MSFLTPLSLFVGARYAQGKKRNRFGSVISGFSVLGMALGVTALILVLSVMNGFNREIQLRFQTVTPHASLIPVSSEAFSRESVSSSQQGIESFLDDSPSVQSYAPVHTGYGLLSTRVSQSPVILNGIDPVRDAEVIPLSESLIYGH